MVTVFPVVVTRTPDESEKQMVVLTTHELVGANLRRIRQSAFHGGKLTQEQFAREITSLGFDWKRITVAEIESGKRAMSLSELLAVAGRYELPINGFFEGDRSDQIQLNDSLVVSVARLHASESRSLPSGE